MDTWRLVCFACGTVDGPTGRDAWSCRCGGKLIPTTDEPVADNNVLLGVGMADETQPALTPEEWGRRMAAGEPSPLIPGDADRRYLDRHATAAVCLHGQPFGFTWEDVDLLRGAADYWRPQDGDAREWDGFAARQQAMRDLADRIAALLPPREG